MKKDNKVAAPKLASNLPKGDALGLGRALARAVKEWMATGHADGIPCIIVLKIKGVDVQGDEADTGQPTLVPTTTVARIEAITDPALLWRVRAALEAQVVQRRGVATLPGFDEKELMEGAFGPRHEKELIEEGFGQRHLDEDDDGEGEMLADDRLLAHVLKFHRWDGDGIVSMASIEAVRAEHNNEHADPEDGMPPHDVTWHGSTPLDLDTAEADQDGYYEDEAPETVGSHPTNV
jgi:hypothetical protein